MSCDSRPLSSIGSLAAQQLLAALPDDDEMMASRTTPDSSHLKVPTSPNDRGTLAFKDSLEAGSSGRNADLQDLSVSSNNVVPLTDAPPLVSAPTLLEDSKTPITPPRTPPRQKIPFPSVAGLLLLSPESATSATPSEQQRVSRFFEKCAEAERLLTFSAVTSECGQLDRCPSDECQSEADVISRKMLDNVAAARDRVARAFGDYDSFCQSPVLSVAGDLVGEAGSVGMGSQQHQQQSDRSGGSLVGAADNPDLESAMADVDEVLMFVREQQQQRRTQPMAAPLHVMVHNGAELDSTSQLHCQPPTSGSLIARSSIASSYTAKDVLFSVASPEEFIDYFEEVDSDMQVCVGSGHHAEYSHMHGSQSVQFNPGSHSANEFDLLGAQEKM